jgi:thiamine kinase-like enzyme
MSASNNKKISKVTNKLLELIKGEPNRKTEKNGEKFFSKWNKLIKDMDV